MNQTFVERLGFDVTPYAVIIWRDGDEAKSKTICYDELEVQVALAMHADPKGFYHQYEPRVYYTAQTEELIA